MYAPRAVRPHRPHIPALLELLLALTAIVLLLVAIAHLGDYRDHVADIQARAQQMAISAGWMALPVTPEARDTWYTEVAAPVASGQPYVRDSWYAEIAPPVVVQPAVRDTWYTELAVPSSMSRPYTHDAWYAEVAPVASFNSVARDYAPFMYRLFELNTMGDPLAYGLLPMPAAGQQRGPY